MIRAAANRSQKRYCGWICALIAIVALTDCNPVSAVQIQDTFREMLEKQLEKSNNDAPIVSLQQEELNPATNDESLLVAPTIEPLTEPLTTPDIYQADPNALPNSVEHFEALAVANHPSLKMLLHEVQAVRAEAVQVSLRTNPSIGIYGEEIFNEGQAGLYGAFISNTHVSSAKLKSRALVKCREAEALTAQYMTAQQRILTDIRTSFYNVLIAQRKQQLAVQLAKSYQAAIDKMELMVSAGELTRSAVLRIEVQYQKSLADKVDADAMYIASWRAMAAVIGDTTLTAQPVEGSLDLFSDPIDFNTALADLVERSPELQFATASVNQAQAVLQREQANTIRNTQTQFTIGRDSASEDVFTGFQVSVPLQKYDRNQGNISAAQSRLLAAQHQSELTARNLAKRLAQEFQNYESAQNRAEIYVSEILPKSRDALNMVSRAFESGEAEFLDLLTAQQTLISTTNDYLSAVQKLWISRQQIEGLLLSDSLGGNN